MDKQCPSSMESIAKKTLLKTRLLGNERIVAEFVEKPSSCCSSGIIRRVQLTTHRVSYLETYRWKCFCFCLAPPSLRQVFLKDICDIAVDNYRRVDEGWLKKLAKALLMLFPIAGIALLGHNYISRSSSRYGYGDDYDIQDVIGAALVLVGIAAIIYDLCRKPAPQIILGTRCPQFDAFAITLSKQADRTKLLEELSELLAKND